MATVLSRSKPTECICPICQKRHWYRFYFTGRGVPRKYCEQCAQQYLHKYRDVIEYRVATDTTNVAYSN